MYGSNQSWDTTLNIMFRLSILGIVLGIWKLIDVAIWIYNNVNITIT